MVVVFAPAALALAAAVLASACGSNASSVLPDARFDAFDLDAERRTSSCGASLSSTPRAVVRAGEARPTSLFANGAGVAWWASERASSEDETGTLYEWHLPVPPLGSGSEPNRIGGAVVVGSGVGTNELFYSPDGSGITRRAPARYESLGSVPNGTSARALLADRDQLFALVATKPCSAPCVEAAGYELVRRPVGSSANWTSIYESSDDRAPIAGMTDLALDDANVYFVTHAGVRDRRDSIRAAEKTGGPVRTLFEAAPRTIVDSGLDDAGDGGVDAGPVAPPCAPPDVCIDGQLYAHAGTLYWIGSGRLYAMPVGGGAPREVFPNGSSLVVSYALDGDFLYTNEDNRAGRLELVRHSLSRVVDDEVLVSQPFIANLDGTRAGPFALAPNAIYVANARLPFEIIGACRR